MEVGKNLKNNADIKTTAKANLMLKCPICGTENEDNVTFCKKCGSRISVVVPTRTASQSAPSAQTATPANSSGQGTNSDDEISGVLVKRLDALKNKDENTIRSLMDEGYSKFDDWAPYRRQEREEALNNEFSAFKVLSNYTYEVKDFKSNVLGDVAVATFTLHYQAIVNKEQYDITSRVTTALVRKSGAWKVFHEHFSRFAQNPTPQDQNARRRGRFPF